MKTILLTLILLLPAHAFPQHHQHEKLLSEIQEIKQLLREQEYQRLLDSHPYNENFPEPIKPLPKHSYPTYYPDNLDNNDNDDIFRPLSSYGLPNSNFDD
jgi:hypothetical protein